MTTFAKQAAAILQGFPTVRSQIPHFCPGERWCVYCLEMREAQRRAKCSLPAQGTEPNALHWKDGAEMTKETDK